MGSMHAGPRILMICVLCSLLLAGACEERRAEPLAPSSDAQEAAPKDAQRTSRSSSPHPSKAADAVFEAAGVRCLEVVTQGADPQAELPLILAIHGLGDRPENFASLVRHFGKPARFILPQGLTSHRDGFSWFPFGLGLLHPDTEAGIRSAAKKLSESIAVISASRPTKNKAIVTGFSQGGALSFALALFHPDSVAAAFPIGGWIASPLPDKAPQRAPRIVALHGEADTLIPILPTKQAILRLSSTGWNAELRPFEGVAHSVPAQVQNELFGLLENALP